MNIVVMVIVKIVMQYSKITKVIIHQMILLNIINSYQKKNTMKNSHKEDLNQ
jgi:hypothetical protein